MRLCARNCACQVCMCFLGEWDLESINFMSLKSVEEDIIFDLKNLNDNTIQARWVKSSVQVKF